MKTISETSGLREIGQCDCACAEPDTLSAWLHLTDRCNLHCDYCYAVGKKSERADMSPAAGRAALDATFRSATAHGYHAVKFKYAGGEPLLRFPLIEELHRYAQAQAARHGVALNGVVLSNGMLLTPEMMEAMLALNLRLMISLDGVGRYHDCQRHSADGRGSFDTVAGAIELAMSRGLTPEISVTVSGRNAAGLPELTAWLLERDLPFSLNFYRAHNETTLEWEEESVIAGMLAAYRVIEAVPPRRSLLAALTDRANLSAPHLYPCSAGRSYLVFDAQGHVSKCQMQMDTPVCDVSADDPLVLVRGDERGLRNPPVDDKGECRECQWRYWCAGGCPLLAQRTAGKYHAKSPHCAIYRALLPEVVRLEELRLLRQAGATAIASHSAPA